MSKKRYEIGSRNVFQDIGVPNAGEHLVKAQLVFKIDTIMKQRRLKHAEAAALLGIRQPDVSKMLRGEFRQFSVERLLRFLVALDQDVQIVIRPHQNRTRLRPCRSPETAGEDPTQAKLAWVGHPHCHKLGSSSTRIVVDWATGRSQGKQPKPDGRSASPNSSQNFSPEDSGYRECLF